MHHFPQIPAKFQIASISKNIASNYFVYQFKLKGQKVKHLKTHIALGQYILLENYMESVEQHQLIMVIKIRLIAQDNRQTLCEN